ncbi:DUF973 family protein [Acidianus sulfidivorans JP7]|uniref:Archaeal Type IV pilin N-terminal domain-containing protein n=1 Tax=Acidianus sulfidivorans JP7 TaxID=619593 RepID=A0A2U9ILG6_9CREN|nr:DUF973 family protein [Acidianus sulfidivorans]AWR96866.1 DUF973 family protein [Acidianus sulfidivorans JP7]
MKGLSDAVIAIILVTATVVASLVVVGFAFGLMPIANKPEIQQIGTGTIYSNGTAVFTLKSSMQCTLISARIEETNYTIYLNQNIKPGTNTYYLTFSNIGSYIHPYNTYYLELTFRDGDVVLVALYSPPS